MRKRVLCPDLLDGVKQPAFTGSLPDEEGNLIGAGDRRDCDG